MLAWGRNAFSDVELLQNVLTGTCVAVSAANDLSQDCKALQLCGIPPRSGFVAQLIGGLAGSIVVPCALYVADDAYGLGTERLIAPQGQMFATLVDGLLLAAKVPFKPVAVGIGIGVVGVLADFLVSRESIQIPAMAMAVGLYLPASLGMGILVGSLCRFAGEQVRMCTKSSNEAFLRTHESVLAASGLITGSAFLDLCLGIGVLAGFSTEQLSLFTTSGEEGKAPLPEVLQTVLAIIGIAALGAISFFNSLNGIADDTVENGKGGGSLQAGPGASMM